MAIEALSDIARGGTSAFAAGGGGTSSAAIFTALATVASVAMRYAEVVVVNAAVTPTSKIMPLLVGELDAENDLEELADTDMGVFAVAEAGQIRFVLTGAGQFVGVFKINYQVA